MREREKENNEALGNFEEEEQKESGERSRDKFHPYGMIWIPKHGQIERVNFLIHYPSNTQFEWHFILTLSQVLSLSHLTELEIFKKEQNPHQQVLSEVKVKRECVFILLLIIIQNDLIIPTHSLWGCVSTRRERE